MSTSTILLISNTRDLHAQRVKSILESKSIHVFLFDFGWFPTHTEISLKSVTPETLFHFPDGECLSGESISAVYCRRPGQPKLRHNVGPSSMRDYIRAEAQAFLDSLPFMMDVFWLCDPRSVRIASCKIRQLALAHNLGFRVPDTIISNSYDDVRQFISRYQYIAVKTLESPGIEIQRQGYSMLTRKLTQKQILKSLNDVVYCPTQFQEYIEKAFELRITIVGELVFACAMHTQQSRKTREDFRRYDLKHTKHEAFILPPVIENKCRQLIKNLGLHFGCIDMIVTPNGAYYFLEVNPSGQWLWIEDLAGLPISKAVADLLMNPPQSRTF